MARRLFVIDDDLMFGQRVRMAAARLQIPVEGVLPAEARHRPWNSSDVVVLQGTLRPQQQLALATYLTGLEPAPIVVAVTGHLETSLRDAFKAAGARLAAHSAMDRALARALQLSEDRDDDHAHDRTRPPA